METTVKALREERIRRLLSRYPDVTPDEAREITAFVKKSSAVEISLFEMDGEIKPMLTHFKRDNREAFGIGPRQVVMIVVAAGLLLLLGYLLWDFGTGG